MHFPQSTFLRLLAPERKLRVVPAVIGREAMPRTAHDALPGDNLNVPGGRDTVMHSSVQAWSAGDFFPAVIAIIERYSAAGALEYACAELTLDGVSRRYATYQDAATVARHLVRNDAARAAWRDTSED